MMLMMLTVERETNRRARRLERVGDLFLSRIGVDQLSSSEVGHYLLGTVGGIGTRADGCWGPVWTTTAQCFSAVAGIPEATPAFSIP